MKTRNDLCGVALGNQAQMLTLRRRGTAKQCIYEFAKDSPWLFAPFADLSSGKYGLPVL